MHTACASELEQNTLSSVCPVLATVVPNMCSFSCVEVRVVVMSGRDNCNTRLVFILY